MGHDFLIFLYPEGKIKPIMLECCVSHHVLPVKDLHDVTEQLAASPRLLMLLQVELQLLRHQRQKDLAAICRDSNVHTHSSRLTHGPDDRLLEAV